MQLNAQMMFLVLGYLLSFISHGKVTRASDANGDLRSLVSESRTCIDLVKRYSSVEPLHEMKGVAASLSSCIND